MVFTSKGIETAPNDAVSSTFSLFFAYFLIKMPIFATCF
jgi:hypothetical protein